MKTVSNTQGATHQLDTTQYAPSKIAGRTAYRR